MSSVSTRLASRAGPLTQRLLNWPEICQKTLLSWPLNHFSRKAAHYHRTSPLIPPHTSKHGERTTSLPVPHSCALRTCPIIPSSKPINSPPPPEPRRPPLLPLRLARPRPASALRNLRNPYLVNARDRNSPHVRRTTGLRSAQFPPKTTYKRGTTQTYPASPKNLSSIPQDAVGG